MHKPTEKKPILTHFPYATPRQGQVEVLQFIEKNWNKYDVFVVTAPTAFGKTSTAKTLLDWQYGASYIAPTNMLVDQFLSEFPDTERLHRLDAYYCEEWKQSCSATRARRTRFCSNCVCSGDLAQAKYRKGPGVYNYYTYLAHSLHRPLLVVDEAHNLVRTLKDRLSKKIWHHDYAYPVGSDNAGLLKWISRLSPNKQKHKKIVELRDALEASVPMFEVAHTSDQFNGKGTTRGEPEERHCIKLYPVDVSDKAAMFWPSDSVDKIVLMSATIGPKDIEELGLNSRKVVYLNAASPIPAEQRPVQFVPVVDINHANMRFAIPILATEIENISRYHSGEKGLVHLTYEMADLLRPHLTDRKYIFHSHEDKAEQYQRFRDSKPESGAVFLASGMYEGIDLPEDLGRWQIVARTPWKSLADPAIRYKAEQDDEWYKWQTLKDLIQSAGRICRTPTDFGVTYILDESAQRLVHGSDNLIPQWFRDALEAGNK